jgi:large subunit ribosomal protein L34e
MPAPKDRTRKKRNVKVKTPSGRVTLHRRPFKPSKPVCADCGAELKGVARGTPAQVGKLSKTQRRPERPYGGVLCSKCSRKKIVESAKK